MIEGPLTGATESDAASAADVTALAAEVAGNTTALGTKAAAADLATAEGTLVTHTGQLVGLTTSFNNIGNSFYNKTLTDALLSGKQATVGDGDLTIARTSGLQTALAGKQASLSNNGGGGVPMLNGTTLRQVSAVAPLSAAILYDFANPSDANNNNVELSVDLSAITTAIADKQDTIAGTFTPTLSTFTTPVTCNFDLQCADLTANSIYGGAAAQIQALIQAQITANYPFWVAGRIWYNGAVLRSQGRSTFTVAHSVGGVYDITFTTPHPNGGNYVITLAHENNQNWDAQTGGIEYGTQSGNGFRVILQHAPSVERSGFFFITALA